VSLMDDMAKLGTLRMPDDDGRLTEVAWVNSTGEITIEFPSEWGLDRGSLLLLVRWIAEVADLTPEEFCRKPSLTTRHTKASR